MSILPTTLRKTTAPGLWADSRGLALIEFAFTLPLILAIGGWGIELSYMSLTQMRVSQYALNLADNASRVGVAAGAGVTTLREGDINDVLQGTKLDGQGIGLTTNGRVILSSLENIDKTKKGKDDQQLQWQRCIGSKSGAEFDSHYGTLDSSGTPKAMKNGMGNPAINAPKDSGVMFVEINYQYKPLFGSLFIGQQPPVRYTASYLVRDNRDFSQLQNPSPAVEPSTCDKYGA